jgi:hypothetical protein
MKKVSEKNQLKSLRQTLRIASSGMAQSKWEEELLNMSETSSLIPDEVENMHYETRLKETKTAIHTDDPMLGLVGICVCPHEKEMRGCRKGKCKRDE